MSSIGNKAVFAQNLARYMKMNDKSRSDVCKDLNIKYTTFTDWLNAKTYPRIDKIELLSNYFGITKADLIEPAGSPTESQFAYAAGLLWASLSQDIPEMNDLVHKAPALDEIIDDASQSPYVLFWVKMVSIALRYSSIISNTAVFQKGGLQIFLILTLGAVTLERDKAYELIQILADISIDEGFREEYNHLLEIKPFSTDDETEK